MVGLNSAWRLLDKVVPNKLLPQIGDFVRIVCALCNKFRPCLGSMDPESSEIATKMLEKADMPNTVQSLVEENNLLTRRAVYSAIEASSDQLDNFPVLSLDDMRTITLGIYQIKHAENYSREHLKDGGSYEIMVCHDFPFLLRVKIQSRHSRNILHTLWIKYDSEKEGVDTYLWLVLYLQMWSKNSGLLCSCVKCVVVSWLETTSE